MFTAVRKKLEHAIGVTSLGFVIDWLGDTVTGVGGASHHALPFFIITKIIIPVSQSKV